jgi:hypothetical protein
VRFSTLAPSSGPPDARDDRVLAGVGRLDHGVFVADVIGVVPCAAFQRVGFGTAIEHVVAAVAGQPVAQCVAGAVDRGACRQDEVLDVVGEGVADQTPDGVTPLIRQFDNGIAALIDDIGVVAFTAAHRVGASGTVEQVVPRGAHEYVLVGGSEKRGGRRGGNLERQWCGDGSTGSVGGRDA